MNSFVQLFVFSVAVSCVFGQNGNLSVTSGPDDYVSAVQNELYHKIELVRKDADTLDIRFADRLAVIELHQQRVINETQQVNQTFIPLQVLSFSRKYCIQAYDSQWKNVSKVQDQFKYCNNLGQSNVYGLTVYARNYLNTAYAYVLNQFARNVVESCKTYAKNQTKLEECYIENVKRQTQIVETQIQNAQKELNSKTILIEDWIMVPLKCSFDVQKRVLQQMNTYTKQVSDCVDQMNKKDVSSTNNGRKYVE